MNKMKSLFFVVASLLIASCGSSGGSSSSSTPVVGPEEQQEEFQPEVINNITEHEFETEWNYDSMFHWHKEVGGNAIDDKIPHTMSDWVTDYEGTETEEGRMSSHCTICPYVEYRYTGKVHTHKFANTYNFDKLFHWRASLCGHPETVVTEPHNLTRRIVQEASFETSGLFEYTCNECEYSYYETTDSDSLEYDYEHYSYNSYGHYHQCISEGLEYLYTDFTSHSFDEWIVEKEASDTEGGVLSSTCTVCGYKTSNVIPTLNHNHTFETEWSSNSTHHYHKSNCGHDVIADNFKHEFIEETLSSPTYESDGQLRKTCSVCGYSTLETLPALSHNFSNKWSCDETSHYHICLDDGYDYLKTDLEEHDFCEWIVTNRPNCYHEGFKFRYCRTCNYVEQEILPLTDHTYSTSWSYISTHHYHAATCGHNGKVSDLEEHTFTSNVVREPTYYSEGVVEYWCTVCGYHYSVNIPKLEHTYSEDYSYDDYGHYHYCIDEGYTYEHTDAEPHVYGDEVYHVQQQNAENGYQYQICSICGYKHILDVDSSSIENIHEYLLFTKTEYEGEECYSVHGMNSIYTNQIAELYIPDNMYGVPVRIIEDNAFSGASYLKRVIFGDNIKYIGQKAFNGTAIENLYIGDGATMAQFSLYRMFSLTNLSIPYLDGQLSYYFSDDINNISSVKNVEIRSARELSSSAFADYFVNMETLSLPDTITDYPEKCFYNCKKLKSISGPKITSEVVQEYAFYQCFQLDNLSFPNVRTANRYAFYHCRKLSSLYCPNLEYVDDCSFDGCSSLAELPSTKITHFGDYSFYECKAFTSLNINENVTYIGRYAFHNCTGISNYTLLPYVVNAIGSDKDPFSGWTSLTSLTIYALPEDDTPLFTGCKNLTHLYIGVPNCENIVARLMGTTTTNNLLNITFLMDNNYQFENTITDYSKKTYAISFDDSCSTVDFANYFGSSSSTGLAVSSIHIGPNVSDIKNVEALDAFTNLTEINVDETNNYYFSNNGLLFSKTTHKLMYVPKGYSGPIYLNDNGMIDPGIFEYQEKIVIDESNPYHKYVDGVLYTNDFSEIVLITSEISTNLHLYETTYVSESTLLMLINPFNNIYGFASVTVDSNNPYYCIENDALMDINKTKIFRVATTQQEYAIPDTVKKICQFAFTGVQSTAVYGGNSLEEIDDYGFCWSSVNKVSFKPGLKTIGTYAFASAMNLQEIYLPATVQYIGTSAFLTHSTITQFTFGGTIAEFDALSANGIFGKQSASVQCSDGKKDY